MGNIVRISAATCMHPRRGGGYWVLRNCGSARKGKELYTSPGGALEATDDFRVSLSSANPSYENPKDIRGTIDEDRLEYVLQQIEAFPLAEAYGQARRELEEELIDLEFPGQTESILTAEEVERIVIRFKEVRRHNPPKVETSAGKGQDTPTYRVFFVFETELPADVEAKLRKSEYVRFLCEEEVATTEGGRHGGKTNDGKDIGTNVFVC